MPIVPILLFLGAAGAFLAVEHSRGKRTVTTTPSPTDVSPQTSTPSALPALDDSLPARNAMAVMVALQKETNPRNLIAFATALEPQYPLAGNALRTQAAILSK